MRMFQDGRSISGDFTSVLAGWALASILGPSTALMSTAPSTEEPSNTSAET